MTTVETLRYFKIETGNLELLEKDIKKCGIDDIDKVSQAFLYNENLSIINVCDLLSDTQTVDLFESCKKYFLRQDVKTTEPFCNESFSETDLQAN